MWERRRCWASMGWCLSVTGARTPAPWSAPSARRARQSQADLLNALRDAIQEQAGGSCQSFTCQQQAKLSN